MGSLDSSTAWRRHPSQFEKGKPEGPYETVDQVQGFGVSNQEMIRFLDFLEQFELEIDHTLSLKKGYNEVHLLTTLIRNHLTGKPSTSSSLIGASRLTYGTAIRALESIEERDLLVRRARTATGKSFSIHPTEKLLSEWQELARRFRAIIGKTYGRISGGENDSYYFGSSYSSERVLPPPTILPSKLPITGKLRLLEHADPTFMAMHSLNKQFETVFGVGINSRALSIDRLREEILKNSHKAKSSYDIVACDLPWFGEMAEAGHFLPVDQLMKESGFSTEDFHPEALASARYKGKQYGIPVQTTPELLIYRRDVFAKFELNPPITIDETLHAAKAIHNPFHGMAGVAWNGARGTPLGHSFLFVIAAFGQPVLNLKKTAFGFDGENVNGEQFRPMFDTPEARMAAEYLLELLEYSPRGILNMSWFERARCYAEGEVGMAYCATLLAPLFETNKASPASGHTEYLPHPFGPAGWPIAPLGGYALAIPSNIAPERINPIWMALTSLTSERTVKLYIENGSLVSPRFSVSQDPEVQKISPLISIVDEMARSGILQMWPRPPVPEITDIIAIVGEEMHDALRGDKSITDALANSQNRADALMRSRGHY